MGISLYNNKIFEGNLLGILTAPINLEETFLVGHSPAWMSVSFLLVPECLAAPDPSSYSSCSATKSNPHTAVNLQCFTCNWQEALVITSTHVILQKSNVPPKRFLLHYGVKLSSVIYKHLCKWTENCMLLIWNDLLPPPPPREEEGKERTGGRSGQEERRKTEGRRRTAHKKVKGLDFYCFGDHWGQSWEERWKAIQIQIIGDHFTVKLKAKVRRWNVFPTLICCGLYYHIVFVAALESINLFGAQCLIKVIVLEAGKHNWHLIQAGNICEQK